MKKVLAILFAFNLFFINPVIFVNDVSDNYVAYADDDAGPGEGGGDSDSGNGVDLTGFDDQFVNEPDAGLGPSDEGFLATLASLVASAVFTVTNAIASVTNALGLDTITNAITSFGYSFGSNVASEEGFTAVAAGAAASAATGGLGGLVVGQVVTGAIQGTLGGDIAGIVNNVTGGTDGPKSGLVSAPGDQTPPYVPNIPKTLGGLSNETEDYCSGNAVNYTINSNDTYKKFVTQDYKPNWGNNDSFVVKINVRAGDTTKGGQLVAMNYSDSLASRAFVRAVISKSKCNFGSNTQWLGMPIGWQPSASDIARYTYADGTKPTQYLGNNSGSATFSINDSRPGVFNLTTGTWYVTFQYLDNCADRNIVNPNRNTTCHKVIEWVGGVQTNNTVDTNDIIKTSGGVVLNNVDTFSLKKSTTGYNDLGVAIPKNLSIEDIINPSLLDTLKSWVGLPVTNPTGGVKSGAVTTGNPVVVTNYCTGSYPDSRFGEYHDWPSRQMYKNTDPTRTYTIEMSIKNTTTAGKLLGQLPQITYELPAGVSNNWNATISRNPCDFSSSAQVVMNNDNSGWKYFTVSDARTNPPGILNLAPGKWYISFKQAAKCLTPGIPADSPNQNDCGIFFELPGYAFQDYIGEGSGVSTPPANPGTTPGSTPGANFTPRTISNSSCSINITGSQYGLVSTNLVYKYFPPNAGGSYWLGSMNTYSPESLAATLPECPSGTSDGTPTSPAKPGNRGTYRNINAECKVTTYNDKTRETSTKIYSLDYPTSCTTLCASANSAAFIDVRGDCVLNGSASF